MSFIKFLLLIWNKQNKRHPIVELNNGQKTILLLDIDGVLLIVAKVRTAKINKSKKYKYWHRDNIIYKK